MNLNEKIKVALKNGSENNTMYPEQLVEMRKIFKDIPKNSKAYMIIREAFYYSQKKSFENKCDSLFK